MVPPAMATAETGGFDMAWLGTVMAINAKYKCTQMMGTARRALGGCLHSQTRKPTKLGTASQRMASDKGSNSAT